MAGDRRPVRGLAAGAGDLAWVLPLLAFVAAFALVPAALLFAHGLAGYGGPAAFGRVLADPVDRRAIENSFSEGAASALAASAIGYPVGVFLGRTVFPGRGAILALLLVPFLLPTVAVAIGIHELFGPAGVLRAAIPGLGRFGSGFDGIVAANVVFNVPVVVLLTTIGVESASAELEETAASLGAGSFERFRTVWGPLSGLGAAAGAILTFLFSALAFAGPILIGGAPWYTVEARVYLLAEGLGESSPAAVLALVAVLALAPITFAYGVALIRLRSGPSRRRGSVGAFDPRNPVTWALVGWTTLVVVGIVVFVGTVVVQGLLPVALDPRTSDPLGTLFAPRIAQAIGISTGGALVNTLLFGGLSSAIALLLALLAARPLRAASGLRQSVGIVAFLPLLISPIVLSLALAALYRPLFGGASSAPLLIVLSQATIALPFTVQGIGLALSSADPRPAESARSLGAGPLSAYLDVELPLVGRSIRTAALFAFAIGLGEFTATNFLAGPGSATLSVELYRLEAARLGGLSGTVASLLALSSLAVLTVLATVGEERTHVL